MLRRLVLFAFVPLTLGCSRENPPADSSSPAHPAATTHLAAQGSPTEAAGIRYIERVTGDASATDPLPLIVAMHGRGDRPEHFARVFEGFHARARLILPYGVEPMGAGFAWFPSSKDTDSTSFQASVERTTQRVSELLKTLASERPTLGKPIVTGFSQGGFESYALAVLHPEAISEAYPIGGRLPLPWPSSWPAGKVTPLIHAFHGDADAMVPINDDRQSAQKLKEIGFSVELSEYPGVEHTISPAMQRDLYAALSAAVERAARP